MRKSTLLLLVAAGACGEAGAAEYVVIEDFLDRSPKLVCEPVPSPGYMAVTQLRAASDSTVVVLDGPGRRLVELDVGLNEVWALELPDAGPGAVNAPVGVALVGDTAIAVAEREGLRLLVFARSGALIRSSPLGFAPAAVVARGSGEVLVTAMPFGDTPRRLLLRYDGARFHELDVPARAYGDMFVGALGNSTLAEALPDGSLLVMHQFLSPRAFRVSAEGAVERLAVPTPDGTRANIDYIPAGPIMEEEVGRMLAPALAMTVDPTRSEFYVMTRSGRHTGRNAERALLRLDAGLELIESFTLDFVGRHLAYLPAHRSLLVVDDEDRFHACDIRHADVHAAAE